MLIEIKGVQFVNKGAELMLYAIIQQLEARLPGAQICLAHNINSPYIKRAKVGALQKVNLRKNIFDLNCLFYFIPAKVRHYFKHRFGIVTEADIDVVLDASGFSYGDQWSNVVIKQLAIEVSRLKRNKKPYIFMSQALGPFSGRYVEPAKKAFSSASLVFSRDLESFTHVEKLINKTSQHTLSPDITHLVNADLAVMDKFKSFSDTIALIVNSKMLSNKNPDFEAKESYLSQMLAVINVLREKQQKVIFLNHDGVADRLICEKLNLQLEDEIDILELDDPIEVKAFIGNCKGVISSRFHGCVSALSQAVPCIAFSWSHKYKMLLDDYNFSSYLITSASSISSIEKMLSSFINLNAADRDKLLHLSSNHKASVHIAWEEIRVSILK